MKCVVCRRQILHCAVPGVPIGPTCAKRRGLWAGERRRVRLFDSRQTRPDPAQLDWVNLINTGTAEESRPT